MAERLIRWLWPLATLVAFLHLVWLMGPELAPLSGGGTPFDMRPLGYTLPEAQAYLGQLTAAGRALYLGPIRLNDTLFPILLTLTLCLPLKGRASLWFLPALIYGLADLGENIAVARILTSETLLPQDVILASSLTQAKFAAVAVAIGLALWALWQAWRQR